MPLLKTQTFHAGGHHATCLQRSRYLERDGRALSVTTHNVSNPARWHTEMDETRRSFGNHGDVTYREFIVSADERDHATPEQIRNLALDWARESFPNCEIAVIVHDDNKERLREGRDGIAHAHVVVNSIDLERGRKVSISNERVRTLHNRLQDMARERGMSEMERYRKGERLRSSQERQRTRAERQIERTGRESWKSSVRDMALQAKEHARNLDEFRTALRTADVDLEVRNGRVYLVDRDNPNRACRADRLDARLSARELGRKFERADRRDLSPEVRARHLAAKLRAEIQREGKQEDLRRKPENRLQNEHGDHCRTQDERAQMEKRTEAQRGHSEDERIREDSPDLLRAAAAAMPRDEEGHYERAQGLQHSARNGRNSKDQSRAFGRDDEPRGR